MLRHAATFLAGGTCTAGAYKLYEAASGGKLQVNEAGALHNYDSKWVRGAKLEDKRWKTDAKLAKVNEKNVLDAARDCMLRNYGMLVTKQDGDGRQEMTARVVDANISETEDCKLWIASKDRTRKVGNMRKHKDATFAFHDSRFDGQSGYTCLVGTVREIENMSEREKVWKDTWWWFYAEGPEQKDIAIFEFTPYRIEVVCNERGIAPAWKPAIVERKAGAGGRGMWQLVQQSGVSSEGVVLIPDDKFVSAEIKRPPPPPPPPPPSPPPSKR